MNDTLLSSNKMLAFNARLAALTDNRLTVGPRAITRGVARALWSTMKVFSPHTVLPAKLPRMPQRRSRLVHRAGTAFALLAAAALAGCTTLGGNVKGSFACRAPDGMCAPTSKIDDQALSMISGGDVDATPATVINPYERTDSPLAHTASANPARSSERVLRIVFPAHVDRLGRYREASAIHAVVARGSWMASAKSASTAPKGQQLAIADYTPSLAELASASPEAVFPTRPGEAVASVDPVSLPAVINTPDPAAVAAARRKGQAVKARATLRRMSFVAIPPRAAPTPISMPQVPRQTASAVPTASTLPRQIANLEAADGAPKPGVLAATVAVAAAPYDLRGAGAGAAPVQSIRDQVGSVLAAKSAVRNASAAPKASTPEQPINGPSVLSVSGVEK